MLNYLHLLVSVRYLLRAEFSLSSDILKIVKCTHSNLSFVDSDLHLPQKKEKNKPKSNPQLEQFKILFIFLAY